jgi:hypothetical protein
MLKTERLQNFSKAPQLLAFLTTVTLLYFVNM